MTAPEPVPLGTPSCAWMPITAIFSGLSVATGNAPSFLSSTMPCRAMSSAISLCLAMSTCGAGPHLSTPTAYAERRTRRTMSERRSFGSLPAA
jgi:hypothetical protein